MFGGKVVGEEDLFIYFDIIILFLWCFLGMGFGTWGRRVIFWGCFGGVGWGVYYVNIMM